MQESAAERSGSSKSPTHTRLHITPLDPDLINVLLSSTLQAKASKISYHSLQTFPEKRYGFLELPREDADKLRSKLNNAKLKGVKIRIEKARPSGVLAPMGEEATASHTAGKDKEGEKRSKKRKHLEAELNGVILENGRKVKRGWTVAADEQKRERRERKEKKEKEDKFENPKVQEKMEERKKRKQDKKRSRSKYIDEPECLVKTVLPANAAAPEGGKDEVRKRGKKAKSREVVIHEFEKTIKFPSFLKATTSAGNSKAALDVEFVDGKGWVNSAGKIVEAVKTRPTVIQTKLLGSPSCVPESGEQKSAPAYEEKSSGSPEEAPGTESESYQETAAKDTEMKSPGIEVSTPKSTPLLSAHSSPSIPSQKSSGSLTLKIVPATAVHPLEALYKRRVPQDGVAAGPATNAEPFSFFGNINWPDIDDEAQEPASQNSFTPSTRLDFVPGRLGSAAPTPNTRQPNARSRLFPPEDRLEGEDDYHEDDERWQGQSGHSGVHGVEVKIAQPTSDFQSWFWANRGDLNRAWKRRRKMAAKEKRYRDNKARLDRAI